MRRRGHAVDADAWAEPLKTLAELNNVAAETDAVFIVLPSSNDAQTVAIQKR